ncbi:unnamed protein product [Sympodiomycopsis kandeliae]
MSGHQFVKHIVRQPPEQLEPTKVFVRAATAASETTNQIYTVTVSGKVIEQNRAAGLAPQAVVVVCGALAVLWITFVMIGVLCKYLNKPRSANHTGDYMNSKGLYQPSAAGYGADRASRPPQGSVTLQPNQDPKKMYGSKTNLLASAGPMGKGSMDSPSMDAGTPDLSLSMSRSREYFDTPTKSSVIGQPGQHHRTTSSSVGLPGPAASRRGPNASHSHHPPVAGPSTMTMDPFAGSSPAGPDGSGFRPGQVFNHSAFGMAGPSHQLRNPPSAPNGPRSSRVMHGQGPPPARSNSNRRSRYSRAPRIESLGPGQIRASRYFEEGADWEQGGMDSPERPANNNRKSRYGDGGRGPASRRSQYGGFDGVRSPSIYGLQAAEEEAIRRAQSEGFGAGSPSVENLHSAGGMAPMRDLRQHHPLGLSRTMSPPEQPSNYRRGASPLGAMAGGPRYPAHPPGPHSGGGIPGGGFAMRQQPQMAGGPSGGRQLL